MEKLNLENPLAVCGLDCSACDIYLIDEDEVIAEQMLAFFKKQGWVPESISVKEFMDKGKFCEGCRGNREAHWSANCELLICCVDNKNLNSCHQCSDFICKKLKEWGNKAEKYAEGIERLRDLKRTTFKV